MKSPNDTNEKWNREIAARGGSLLQSWEWGKLQEHLGRSVHCLPQSQTLLVSMPLPFGMRYEYAPHGPTGGALNGAALHELAAHTRSTRTIFLRVEPRVADTPETRGVLTHAGFRKVSDVQPRETRIIDLVKSKEELLHDMEHDTRYAIRAAEKRGVTVEFAGGEATRAAFAKFWELFEATNVRHGLHAYDKRYYEAIAELGGDLPALPAQAGQAGCFAEIFLARQNPSTGSGQEGETLAASIVAYFGTAAYYLYAASRAGYGKYNAPSLLLFEIIRRAKERGCKTLDLWGASETKKEWKGVTAFKKSFGGIPVSFVGTWDYIYRPLWYRAYRLVSDFRK